MSCDTRIIDFNYCMQPETDIFVTSENPDYPKENIKDFLRSKVFRSSSVSGEQAVVFDLKTIEEIDSFCFFADPFSGFKISQSSVIKLQASATNVWSSPPVDITLSIDESNQLSTHFFTTVQSYRFWRVSVTDAFNPYGYIEFGKIVLGKALELDRVPEIGFSLELQDLSRGDSTPYGHKYFDIYPNRKTLSVDLNLLPENDLYEWIKSYERVGRVAPVVISLDSSEQIFDKDTFTIYGTYMSGINAQHVVRGYFNMPMQIEELF